MSNVHEHKIRNIYADIANLDDNVISYLRRKGINPLNDRLVISDEIIQYILRDSKALANKGIPRDELVDAVHNINNCNIYFDDVKNKCTQLAKYIHWRHADFNNGNIISRYVVKNDSAELITAAEIEKGEEAIISELKKWIYSRNYRSNIDVRSLKLSRLLSTSIYFAQS